MTIQTSYFAKYKDQPNGIAITRYTPKWFKGETYSALAPTKAMLDAYKAGRLSEEDFIKQYQQKVLEPLCVYEVYHDLKGKTLLCFETSDSFCHRHLVASWLTSELGIDVLEV